MLHVTQVLDGNGIEVFLILNVVLGLKSKMLLHLFRCNGASVSLCFRPLLLMTSMEEFIHGQKCMTVGLILYTHT